MAGIGFELKRLFSRKGLLATARAYGYAGIVCTGPMLLGLSLIIGSMFVTSLGGATRNEQELLVAMLTYALLFSLALTSLFSMITTRCVADLLYIKQPERVMPSFYGSICLMLLIGVPSYGIFLHFSGISLLYQALCLLLFALLIVVWTQINYLTAIKDYKSILLAFFVSLLCALLIGYVLSVVFHMEPIAAMLIGICCGYGIMCVWYYTLLCLYFPTGIGSSLYFMRWMAQYPPLALVGFLITCGLFGHLVLMWASPAGVQVQGLFYGAPSHDIPALIAFFSILVTTINFVTSVEVRFYPAYRNYFSLFNDKGAIVDILETENQMMSILKQEISYLAQKQIYTTVLFIVLGTILLPRLPLGFTSQMLGTYRILCVGYALYAIANSLMLLSLYFSDNRGALLGSAVFAVLSCVLTALLMNKGPAFYGLGFLLGGAGFFLAAWVRLAVYLRKLKYHVLSCQPVFAREAGGPLVRLCNYLDKRALRKQRLAKAQGQPISMKGEHA